MNTRQAISQDKKSAAIELQLMFRSFTNVTGRFVSLLQALSWGPNALAVRSFDFPVKCCTTLHGGRAERIGREGTGGIGIRLKSSADPRYDWSRMIL